jgi:hypothetical protein
LQRTLHIAVPLLDELENIPNLLDLISQQISRNFKAYFCVNQPDDWWFDSEKISICHNNQTSIQYITRWAKAQAFETILIDKSSRGNGWKGKNLGVGWARKTLFDTILSTTSPEDIIVSLDADTFYNHSFILDIEQYFYSNENISALSLPYYHPLNQNLEASKSILRYEIYMRYYLLMLFEINSPYSFTALGSGMAFKVKALKKLGGFSPKLSGEDFYFLQKIVKTGRLGLWIDNRVEPQARFSNRVFFGTGPAMIKGNQGNWSSYPLYPKRFFYQIKAFYDLVPLLFQDNIPTPIDDFLGGTPQAHVLWNKLRSNFKTLENFTKALHDYFDGLRILQFVKSQKWEESDEEILTQFLKDNPSEDYPLPLKNLKFEASSIDDLNEIRNYLCKLEIKQRTIKPWTQNSSVS